MVSPEGRAPGQDSGATDRGVGPEVGSRTDVVATVGLVRPDRPPRSLRSKRCFELTFLAFAIALAQLPALAVEDGPGQPVGTDADPVLPSPHLSRSCRVEWLAVLIAVRG